MEAGLLNGKCGFGYVASLPVDAPRLPDKGAEEDWGRSAVPTMV